MCVAEIIDVENSPKLVMVSKMTMHTRVFPESGSTDSFIFCKVHRHTECRSGFKLASLNIKFVLNGPKLDT